MARARQYQDTQELSDAEVLDRAEDIVDHFLEFVRGQGGCTDIFDVSALPVSKTTLESAFRLVIATEARPEYRAKLAKAGLLLSRFQQGIGPKISLAPAGAENAVPEIEVSPSENRTYIERFDRAFALIEPDARRISALFERSMRIAERRAMNIHSPQISSDGTYTWHGGR